MGALRGIGFRYSGLLGVALLVLVSSPLRAEEAPGWLKTLTPPPATRFAELPPFSCSAVFGWSGIQAAKAQASLKYEDGVGISVVEGNTTGLARQLYRLDVTQTGRFERASLRSLDFELKEVYRKRSIQTRVKFFDWGAERWREVKPSSSKPKWKKFPYAPVHSVIGGMLEVRSYPLATGEDIRLLVFPSENPYVVDVRVAAREKILVAGEQRDAIRFDLKIQRVVTKGERKGSLERHDKFRSGRAWISDDAARIPLRAEVDIFIGYVFAELEKWQFQEVGSPAGSNPPVTPP